MEKDWIKKGLSTAFTFDRVIWRLIASWLSFAALVLLLYPEGFATANKEEYAPEIGLAIALIAIVLFFVLYSAAAALVCRVHTDSWFLLLSSCVCAFYWLLEYNHDKNEILFFLTVAILLALVVICFLRANQDLFAKWNPGKRTLIIVTVLTSVCACVILSVTTCMRYRTFSSPNFDFGLFCNMFYNMKETGLPLITSERDRLLSHFAVHISPVFYILLPFFWLFPYPETLQIGQAVFLMAGIIPVVLLARHFKLSGKTTLLISCLYAFYPAISTGCFYDIHENCFLPFFLLWTFYFFEKKKYLPMYLMALGVLGVKEDAAIYLLIFAAFVLISERKYLHGSMLALMSVAYFGLAYYLLQTFGTGVLSDRFNNLIFDKEAGLFGVVKLLFTNPGYLFTQLFTTSKGTWDKVGFFLQMLLPLGFLPFCSKKPSRWLLLCPILINMVSYYQYLYHLNFQYHFAVSAFLFYAVLKNLPELTLPTRRNLLGLAAAACCCLYLVTVIPKMDSYLNKWERNRETYVEMEAILDTIPEDASVSCSTMLLAHIADCDVLYDVTYHKNKPDVDYVVLDARNQEYLAIQRAYLAQGYRVLETHEGLIVILVSPTHSAQKS